MTRSGGRGEDYKTWECTNYGLRWQPKESFNFSSVTDMWLVPDDPGDDPIKVRLEDGRTIVYEDCNNEKAMKMMHQLWRVWKLYQIERDSKQSKRKKK